MFLKILKPLKVSQKFFDTPKASQRSVKLLEALEASETL